jgi:hypothetical protein
MNLDAAWKIPDHVIAREVGDETILLDVLAGTYFGLNEVGTRIWQLLGEGRSLVAVCDVLEAEYQTSRAVVEQDVGTLAAQLLAQKLIVADEGRQCRSGPRE